MPRYIFALGNTPQLSLLELKSLVNVPVEYQAAQKQAVVELPSDHSAQELLQTLGGSTEVYKESSDGGMLRISRFSWRAWLQRDRNKPYSDHKKGMLPPKVARMMVNIAAGQWQKLHGDRATQPTLYDPFCGSGTVLLEASLRGLPVIGSDIDAAAVAGSKKNLQWLQKKQQLTPKSQIFQADVSHVSGDEADFPVALLVTEPFLGKPRPQPEQVPNIFKGLGKLYLGAFKNWRQLLEDGAVVCCVFPRVTIAGKTHTLTSLIDKLEELGYSTLFGAMQYSRPEAIVKREIYLFKYSKVQNGKK